MGWFQRIKKIPRFLARKITSTIESVRGRIDKRRLLKQFPPLQDFDVYAAEIRAQLKPLYEQYTSTVSTEAMALSLETSVFLAVFYNILKPKRMLDLGSGFSSAVFRLVTKEAKPRPVIWSIDDDSGWLARTRTYLAKLGLPSDNLLSWQAFSRRKFDHFDFILYDLGRTPVRKALFSEIIPLAPPGGVIILDDVHKHDYWVHAKNILREANLTYYSLKAFTFDRFGRYCALIMP